MDSGRLAIVLATPPGFNPGMAVTELALAAFLRRHGWENAARCYRIMTLDDRLGLLPPEQRARAAPGADTGLRYHSAFAAFDEIRASDGVLYWADFLHMAGYVRHLEELFARRGIAAGAQLAQLLLLDGAAEDVLAKSVTFGTSLLFNTLHDERDAAYGTALRRFLRDAKRVWVRDALSAARVAHLRGDYDTGYFGVDCALLLSREDVLREAAEPGAPCEPHDAGSVLAFFGREPSAREQLTTVAVEMGRALDRPVCWLRWGDSGGFPHLQPRPETIADTRFTTVQGLLGALAHASAVVTDTYHLAVTAWNFGVPAICAFTGHTLGGDDVSSGAAFNWRDKREVFYSQYDALDFLIRPEELADEALLARRVAHVKAMLRDVALHELITGRMRAHARAAEAALAAEIAGARLV
ncbi:MAG TPA: polysaccharide pyruvyl transferase family protein [Candidatus Elarobacter sp.]|nr:polysaccharide pyruvyl transferase family protein [Candidatus Elarobacter sp.]